MAHVFEIEEDLVVHNAEERHQVRTVVPRLQVEHTLHAHLFDHD